MLQLTPAELQQSLPENVALVDFLEYTHFDPPRGGKGPLTQEQRLAAFVLRKDRPIVRIELGPVKPLAIATEAWRRAILRDAGAADEVAARRPTRPKTAATNPERLLWTPLEEQLKGPRPF